jgi:tetratricopeptide (TPR) repeat protein
MTGIQRPRIFVIMMLSLALLAGCSRDPNVRKQKYLESGNQYFDTGKYAEASIQYENAIQIDPRFAEAHYRLAQSYLKRGIWSGAHQELMRTVDIQPQNLKAQIDLGDLLLAAHQFKGAQERAQLVLTQDPNNVDAHILMANSYAALQDMQSSLDEMRTAIQLAPESPRSYLNLALLQVDAKQAEAAELNFLKAIDLDSKSVSARLALGNFYLRQKRFSEAERQFRTALQISPQTPAPYAALAALYSSQGQKPQAEQILQQAKQAMPNNPDGYRMLGDFYFSTGDLPDALKEYASLNSQHSQDLPVRKTYIQLLILAGKLDVAKPLSDALLKDTSNDADSVVLKGQIQKAQGNLPDARLTFESAVKSAPENPAAHYYLGITLAELGNTENAESELRKAVEIRPGMVEADKALAAIALNQRAFSLLRETAGRMIVARPHSADGYLLHARALLNTGDEKGAVEDIHQAILMAPEDSRGYTAQGEINLIHKEFPEAEKNFELALSKNSRAAEALSDLVRALLLDKQPGKALERVKQQISKVPDDGDFYMILGQLQVSQKDLGAAEESIGRAIALNPKSMDADLALADVQRARGSVDVARATLQSAIQKNPKDSRPYLALGILEESQSNWRQAEQQYRKALNANPNDPVAANNLAYLLVEHGGNLDEALTFAQTARQFAPDSPQMADTLAWVYCQKGAYQLAVSLLEDAVKKVPQSQTYQYHLGVAYKGLNELPKAKLCLQRALHIDPKSSQADAIRKALSEISN